MKKKKTIKKITVIFAGLMINMLLIASRVYAVDVKWQRNNAAILANNSVSGDGFRHISWGITKLFARLASIAEILYDKTFGMIDITKYPKIEELINSFYPVLVALIVLCVIGLGISYIVIQEKKPLVRNILLIGLTLSSSIYLFTTANSLLNSFKTAVLNENKSSSVYSVIDNNLIDLIGIDKSGNISELDYSKGKGIIHNAGIVNQDSLYDINITEVINYSDKKEGQKLYGWSDTFNEYMKYKAINVGDTQLPAKVYDGILRSTIGNEFYYRYSFDFWTCTLELATIILLYFAMSYKNVRIAYELITSRFFAFFYAADVGGGERLKQILYFIKDTYIALCISIMSIKIFLIITEAMPSVGITGLQKGIIALFLAFIVIDGPNLSERILGIDAGLSSSFARTMAIFGIARNGGKAVKSVVRGGVKVGAAAATGKSAHERKAASGYSTIGESIGKAAYNKFSQKKTKEGEEKRAEKNSGYGEPSFMNSKESARNEGRQNEKEQSKRKYSTAAFMNENNTHAMLGSTSLNKETAETENGKNLKNNARFSNPEFARKVKELAPDKSSSLGERRDFNKQVNNIVRGNHKAIKPDENARAEYKETNYRKAIILEKAYHSKQKGDNDGTK